jgi:hypothetical protein
MANEDQVHRLFMQYTWLRQTESCRRDAWTNIQSDAALLPPVERNRLLALLRDWETKDGQAHRKAEEDDPFQTHFTAPEGLKELRQSMNATKGIRRIKSANTVVVAEPERVCNSCHTSNPSGTLHCIQCGNLLGWAGPVPLKDETQPLILAGGEDAHFSNEMSLHLLVHGVDAVIRVRPGASEMVIGRRSPDSVMIPDVDLSPYSADIKGVSRLHAGLKRHGQTIVITDMGSLNHTYVNEQRLHPHEVRVLHNGDEIRFGQLALQVQFHREER